MPIYNGQFWSVKPVDNGVIPLIQGEIDSKTKPPGSLGQLEALARQLAACQWQGEIRPVYLTHPTMLVFAADHGIATHNISIAPQAVTRQMVMNFLNGGAAINTFCASAGLALQVIDCGILDPVTGEHDNFINSRVAAGTKDMSKQPAMTATEAEVALLQGAEVAKAAIEAGANVLGFGEMGIGNTSAAAALICLLTDIPLDELVGAGTGISEHQYIRKHALLQQTVNRVENTHGELPVNAEIAIREAGGFEIAQIAGAMLATAQAGNIILVDGFIVTSAALLALHIAPEVRDYMVFCHCSGERGHRRVLDYLNAQPLLSLGLRLGEGTGAALAMPLLKAAAAFYNDMATFDGAGVVLSS